MQSTWATEDSLYEGHEHPDIGTPHWGYVVCKRFFDIVLGSAALIILSPLIAVITLLIRLTSPGPAIYRQERVGRGGRRFMLLKFRSMYNNQSDASHRLAFERFLTGMPVAEGAAVNPYKLRVDPRITPIGRILRRTSFDEVPQLWNIVRGDMALVGPRPPIHYEVEKYERRHLRRLSVTPGLTGLWQVRGRSRVTFEEMVALDIEYIAKRSILFDMKILLATIPAVIRGSGAG